VEAEGYNTFRGSFKISEPVKTYNIKLKKDSDSEDDTTEDTESTNDTTEDSESTTNENSTTTEDKKGSDSSTENKKTDNVITVKTPEGVGVYLDGEYVGTAPVSFPKTVGTHTITLYKTGYLIKSYTIQANDDGKDDEYNFSALTSVLDTIQ
ncbi:MAG: PEGA domain-containing protein, partial [Lachnospiraceae bacterium]|nr:PEGA domain-containing protein [Lachnospiraceae bacterium]